MADIATLFPDSNGTLPSLYGLLSPTLTASSTPAEIRSAYRRSALSCHPDKLPPTSTPVELSAASVKFAQIGFAYDVLKDEKRRERYDKTGETGEAVSMSEGEWKDYFKELWKGELNAETLDEFKNKYQGSEEEKSDLIASYQASSGSLETILSNIMCSSIDDEDRFISIIDSLIKSKVLTSTTEWKNSIKDTKAKAKRREKATKEAGEAEAYAKELGVHDKLYGDGSKKSSQSSKGKGKATKGGEGDDDMESLRSLIQSKQANRMDSLIGNLEAKYAAQEKDKKAAKGAKTSGKGKKRAEAEIEPTDEEFEKIQKEMDARRGSEGNKKKKSS